MSDDSGGEKGDDIAFLKEAIFSLSMPSLALPILLAVAGTAACSLVMISYLPAGDDPDLVAVHALSVARLLLQTMVSVAALRILNGSRRSPWKPDASFWASILVALTTFPIALLAVSIVDRPGLSSWLAFQFLVIALGAPLLPWFVAIAVERPLAWRPFPFLRRFRAWLPPLLLWNFLIIVPATLLYQIIEGEMIASADAWLVLLDGLLGVSIIFVGLALASVAYRRVSRV